MKKHLRKATNIYKNQGPKVLSQKAVRFGLTKVFESLHIQYTDKQYRQLREEYSFVGNRIFQITKSDVEISKETTKTAKLGKVKTANWFVPNFNHLSFGGIYTIFRFIEKFSIEGVTNRIIIYDHPSFDVAKLDAQIKQTFPKLINYEIIIFDHARDEVDSLPESDIAICSFWVSAYLLLKFNKTKRKYYFIQDYEPIFYAGGSTSALAESTYRFGFKGIVNTPGLLAAVNQRHGMEGFSFVPAVDKKIYFPRQPDVQNKKIKIFFYARPHNPRNAFNLGITIVKDLIKMYGDRIEIVTAGAEWKEVAYGLRGKITNLGLLKSIDEVAELYRSCDIGFVYMLSKHPSYQPFEFMASGMATVTNNNEDNLWFLKDGDNCLVAEPSPASMAEKIGWLIEDEALRERIKKNGLKTVTGEWDSQLNQIWLEISEQ